MEALKYASAHHELCLGRGGDNDVRWMKEKGRC